MVYLKKFTLLDEIQEHNIEFNEERRNIFNNYYPLHLFSSKSFKEINFDKITIFYGGNGSGKTTLINMISQKLNASRKSPIDKGSYFDLYVEHCDYEMSFEQPMEIKLITSDDVFDYLIDVRSINANVNRQKERLSKEYLDYKFNNNGNSFDNYDELKMSYDSKRKSMSKFVRERLGNNNIIEWSNIYVHTERRPLFWIPYIVFKYLKYVKNECTNGYRQDTGTITLYPPLIYEDSDVYKKICEEIKNLYR